MLFTAVCLVFAAACGSKHGQHLAIFALVTNTGGALHHLDDVAAGGGPGNDYHEAELAGPEYDIASEEPSGKLARGARKPSVYLGFGDADMAA